MISFISRRKETVSFSAFLILGCFLTSAAFAQMTAPVHAAEQKDTASSQTQIEKPKRKLPTGLLQLQGFKDPVYLYVPEGLEAEKKYPLLVMVPSETHTPEEQLEYMVPTAKSLECFVLAPHNTWPKDTPYEIDKWLLKVKSEIMSRFPIDSSKVFAIGRDYGAQYAAYLVTAYPEEFSGAALMGEAWEGPFTSLLKPRQNAVEQLPVVAAFTADQQNQKTKNEKWVLEYQRLGYPVQVMTPPEGQDFNSPEFKVAVLEWLDQKAKAWKLVREEKNKTLKQRLKKGIKDFFEV